jgi:hypothetical protein
LHVGQETATGFVVRVGNIVSEHHGFAGDLAFAAHDENPLFSG